MWSDRPSSCGVPAGESTGCSDRVREVAVPQPASAFWPLTAASPCSACRAGKPHLPALLHATGRQDTYRDADPRHAAVRELHKLAIRPGTMKPVHYRVRRQRSDGEDELTYYCRPGFFEAKALFVSVEVVYFSLGGTRQTKLLTGNRM